MNRRERVMLRRLSVALGNASSLPPLNPADIARVSIACREIAAVCKLSSIALASVSDESAGGVEGAEDSLDSINETIEQARAAGDAAAERRPNRA